MKLTKTQWLTFAGLAAISVIAGGIYMANQVKAALRYSYSFSRIKLNKINMDAILFDVWFNLNNPSGMNYTIRSISTKVKVGDQIIAEFVNDKSQPILAKATTEIMVSAMIQPKLIVEAGGQKWTSIVRNIDTIGNTQITMEMIFSIGYMGNLLNINVPYTYSFPLKDILPRTNKK